MGLSDASFHGRVEGGDCIGCIHLSLFGSFIDDCETGIAESSIFAATPLFLSRLARSVSIDEEVVILLTQIFELSFQFEFVLQELFMFGAGQLVQFLDVDLQVQQVLLVLVLDVVQLFLHRGKGNLQVPVLLRQLLGFSPQPADCLPPLLQKTHLNLPQRRLLLQQLLTEPCLFFPAFFELLLQFPALVGQGIDHLFVGLAPAALRLHQFLIYFVRKLLDLLPQQLPKATCLPQMFFSEREIAFSQLQHRSSDNPYLISYLGCFVLDPKELGGLRQARTALDIQIVFCGNRILGMVSEVVALGGLAGEESDFFTDIVEGGAIFYLDGGAL